MRHQIVRLYEEGRSTQAIAQMLGTCKSATRRIRQNQRERGTLDPLPHGGGRAGGLTGEVEALLRSSLDGRPDLFHRELAEMLAEQLRVQVTPRTVGNWLAKLGLSRKKRRCGPASRSGRT